MTGTQTSGEKVAHLEEVAQGRLFTGLQAKDAGLVDNVQTLNETIAAAAKSVGIEKNYQTLPLPEAKTLADWLVSADGQQAIAAYRVNGETPFQASAASTR